ncbi:MAG: response regulator [Candidatus Choladocola sp.]|nr:response regulator [Candidatus Choladocola sp.]
MCDTVAKSLYHAGYEVDTCYDGEEALECILTENYDLIVLDLNLPGMDGMEILKELRQRNEETKVLILSARGQIADKVEGLDAGANDYMEKPFHLQELEDRIRSLTRRKFVQKDVCLESGAIRVHMSSLRKKLKIVLGYDPIRNKVGEGYHIREESGR